MYLRKGYMCRHISLYMHIRFNKKTKTDTISDIDKLVDEMDSLYGDDNKLKDGNIFKFDTLDALVYSIILFRTNLRSSFEDARCSYKPNKWGFSIIYAALATMKNEGIEFNSMNMMAQLNSMLENQKSYPMKEYAAYFPTKMCFADKDKIEVLNKSLCKLVKDKKISLESSPQKHISPMIGTVYHTYLTNRELYIKISSKARDEYYFVDKTVDTSYSIAGMILYSLHCFKNTLSINKEVIDSMVEKESIAPHLLELYPLFLMTSDENKIIFPETPIDYNIYITPILKCNDKKKIDNDAYEKLDWIVCNLSRLKNKMPGCILTCFSIYYKALTEGKLNYSFLLFWIIIEMIVKKPGNIEDEILIDSLASLTGMKNSNIKHIYKKRCDMVHEYNVDYITQADRNYVKKMCDILIAIILNPKNNINNFEDFKKYQKYIKTTS